MAAAELAIQSLTGVFRFVAAAELAMLSVTGVFTFMAASLAAAELAMQSATDILWCSWLQRICNAEYQVPGGVEISPELETLLQGMLEPNSSRRMQVADIMEDPWFTEGLPPGVVEMNARLPDGPKPGEGQVPLPITAPCSFNPQKPHHDASHKQLQVHLPLVAPFSFISQISQITRLRSSCGRDAMLPSRLH